MEFKLGIRAITLFLPGGPIRGTQRAKEVGLKSYMDKPREQLAKMRRKFKPFGIFTNTCVVRQLSVRHCIAYQKMHIVADATEEHITVLRTYWEDQYWWSPTRIVRRFDTFGEAIQWLLPKAHHPFEEWETAEDLELLLNGVRHIPLIYGLGDFRKIGQIE